MTFADSPLYLLFAAFAAMVSVTMWIDYFRRIDVFEKEKVAPLLLALLIGGCTPYLSLWVYEKIHDAGFRHNGEIINDLLYAVFAIGLNEELCKLLGVFFTFFLLQKQIDEPIDYLIYAGVTALGFSLVENYNYFNNHGVRIITSRAFYSALEHIINTSIIVYGIYRTKIFKKGDPFINTTLAFIIAVASHGLFDFFLIDSVSGYFTAFLSIFIYLVGINFWIQMLNNANNYSNFFDYDKIHFAPRLVYRLLFWYALTILIAFVNNVLVADLRFSIITFVYGILSDGFLFFIVILRVSRFKILRSAYFEVRLGFPFYITKNKDEDFTVPFLNWPIKVRGENHKEHFLTKYLNRRIFLYPVDEKTSEIKRMVKANVENKYLLFDDVVVYKISFQEKVTEKNGIFLLKPRMGSISQVHHRYPVHGLYYIELQLNDADLSHTNYSQLQFIEWVYLKP